MEDSGVFLRQLHAGVQLWHCQTLYGECSGAGPPHPIHPQVRAVAA